MGERGILRTINDNRVGFWCPGCNEMHQVRIPPHSHAWGFNGNYEKPTFTPSVLVTGKRRLTDDERERILAGEKVEIPNMRCHSFVTDGRIQFLADCTHDLAGQTVDLHAKPE